MIVLFIYDINKNKQVFVFYITNYFSIFSLSLKYAYKVNILVAYRINNKRAQFRIISSQCLCFRGMVQFFILQQKLTKVNKFLDFT